ncbi:hypothetical protein VNO77_05927 [Canavalia gladiata]|uniref:Uncharacterized protein n=1 Tax=Canavalia gladiata TaxID=3824 RepID=A0AAN9R635_CANGL
MRNQTEEGEGERFCASINVFFASQDFNFKSHTISSSFFINLIMNTLRCKFEFASDDGDGFDFKLRLSKLIRKI